MTRSLWSLAFALAWHGVALGASQGEVEIVHDPIECWPVDQFLMLRSSFVPPEDIQTAKFYFRSTEHPDYYYVEMTLGLDGGTALGPKAEPSTAGVTYYIELVTRSYSSYRTAEREVPVASGDECRRRDPEAAYYTGQNPDIAVGATRTGATPLPPGFQSEGITRFLNATGIAGESGGGVSGKTLGIIGGLGGAGAAALALSGGSKSNPTTTSPVGGSTSSVAVSSTSTAIGGGSSSTTTTTGGGGSSTSSITTTVGSTTTVVGSTTTVVGGSTTTTTVGTSTSTSVPTSTSSSTTTSVGSSSSSSSTTTSVGSSSSSSSTSTSAGSSSTTSSVTSSSSSTSSSTTTRPTTSVPGAPDVSVSKSASPNPVVVNQVLTYTLTVRNNGPGTANSVQLTDIHPSTLRFLGSDLGCAPSSPTQVSCNLGSMPSGSTQTKRVRFQPTATGSIQNTATVFSLNDPDTSNNIARVTTRVTANLRDESGALELTYRSSLKLEPSAGGAGQIVWNGSYAQETTASGEFVYMVKVIEGENRIAAHWTATGTARGSWRFDFSSASQFLPGTLRVQSGQVLSQDGSSIVFALRPDAPSPQFTIQVGAGGRTPLLR